MNELESRALEEVTLSYAVVRSEEHLKILSIIKEVIAGYEEKLQVGHFVYLQHDARPEFYTFVATPDGQFLLPVFTVEIRSGSIIQSTWAGGETATINRFEVMNESFVGAIYQVLPTLLKWRNAERIGLTALTVP